MIHSTISPDPGRKSLLAQVIANAFGGLAIVLLIVTSGGSTGVGGGRPGGIWGQRLTKAKPLRPTDTMILLLHSPHLMTLAPIAFILSLLCSLGFVIVRESIPPWMIWAVSAGNLSL